jgi:oligoendopeptidase F
MSVQGESLGPVFNFMDGYETFGPNSTSSSTTLYVYAYAFGGLNALYAVYEDMGETSKINTSTCSRQADQNTTANCSPGL